jgi:hypothetical protein
VDSDPDPQHWFLKCFGFADPDPAFYLNADPDQGAKAIWIVDPSGSWSEIAVIKKSDFDIKKFILCTGSGSGSSFLPQCRSGSGSQTNVVPSGSGSWSDIAVIKKNWVST